MGILQKHNKKAYTDKATKQAAITEFYTTRLL